MARYDTPFGSDFCYEHMPTPSKPHSPKSLSLKSESRSSRSPTPLQGQWIESEQLAMTMFSTIWLKEYHNLQNQKTMVRAVKKIRKTPFTEASNVLNLEMKSSSKFSNLHCRESFVQLLACYEEPGFLCIDMEYSFYGTLERCITPPLQEPEVQSIASQVLSGLHFLHATDTAHLSLRPVNILVMSRGPWRVKLGDFGAIKTPEPIPSNPDQLSSSTGYLAPELLGLTSSHHHDGDDLSTAIDIWALGEILYRALTGTQTFTRSTIMAYTKLRSSFPRDALRQSGVGIHGWHFLGILMAPDPWDRPNAGAALDHPWVKQTAVMDSLQRQIDVSNHDYL